MFSTGFTSLSALLLFIHLFTSSSSSLSAVFYSLLPNIDEVLLINPSANVFVFEDFNIHQKGWLTYSGRTDRPGELWYNFSISNDLTQMVNFPTQIPVTLTVLPFKIYLFLLPLVFVLQ